MRLLKREKSGWFSTTFTFSLTRYDPQKIPQYAILSHRWGSDEVTFKDLEDGTAKNKAGYAKLEFCAKQAASDGLVYFWIDTCCINKSSSAELSEAINSMFKWYKDATKCYVCLPDVFTGSNAHGSSSIDSWERAFEESEWFTRGWTLQELIAPTSVEFFSVEGTKLGDKRSLEDKIHHITGISHEVLRGKSLVEVDPEERFAWTTDRQTTIEEDMVYCLLGVFDIHMSLIYGEGQHKALARLQRKIQKSPKETSLVAADSPWIVPFERNPYFTGRETELAELEGKIFYQKDHTSKIAVTGLGGVGKTQLVLEILHKVRAKHKDCSIIWIPATTMESLQQGYLTVARQLKIPGHEGKEAETMVLVQEYLSRANSGPWLLVFDNADDIDMWLTPVQKPECSSQEAETQRSSGSALRLIDCLPKNGRGCIIFTTRDRKAAVKLAQQNIVDVSELSKDVATQLLKKSLVNAKLVDDVQHLTALLEVLTYLPLAIVQAAAYINATDITLADYVSLLENKEENAIEILSEDFEDYGRYQSIKNPIATTWLISFEQIRRSDPLAAEYLSFIACILPKDIPQSLLPSGPSRKKEMDAIGTLKAYSFVNLRPASTAFDMHRLVHLATRNWLRKEGLLSQAIEKSTTHLNQVFPDGDDHTNRTIWRLYLPHALHISTFAIDGLGESRLDLLLKCGKCLDMDGRWEQAESTISEVLTRSLEISGEETRFTISVMAHLGGLYARQGKLVEAEQLLRHVTIVILTELGVGHIDTARAMCCLADLYTYQGRLQEAEQLYLQFVEVFEMRLGRDSVQTMDCVENLAMTYYEQGRLDEAERLLGQQVERYTTKLEMTNPRRLNAMDNLALIYIKQKRLEEAEKLNIQVLEIKKTTLGYTHIDTTNGMGNLAMIYEAQGRLEEAEKLTLQVIEIRTVESGIDHLDTHNAINNLGVIYFRQNRFNEAEQVLLRALKIRRAKLGIDHPKTLVSASNLAWTWQKMGQKEQALRLMKECAQGRSRTLGDKHPDALESDRTWKVWAAELLSVRARASASASAESADADNTT